MYSYFFMLKLIFVCFLAVLISCNKDKPAHNNNNEEEPTITGCGTVTDIDGNVYNSVIIGTQCWMKANLKSIKYRNGDIIGTTIPDTLEIAAETDPKYQWAYEGLAANVSTYGRLYTWYAATDSRGLCPLGWHLPTDSEWTTLIEHLDSDSAGSKLKEAGTAHWYSPNAFSTNQSGFTALPGGYRTPDGMFRNINFYGNWWSATEVNATNAYDRHITYNSVIVNRGNNTKKLGLAIRCIKD